MTASRRLVFVLNSLIVGGSESKIIRVANSLARSGSDVAIAYLNEPHTLKDAVSAEVAMTHLGRRGLYSGAALRGLKSLLERRPSVVISVNLYPLLYAVPASALSGGSNYPVVSLVNTAEPGHLRRRDAMVYGPFLQRCSRVVFGCEAQRSSWVEYYGLRPSHTDVIFNGVDSDYFSPAFRPLPGQVTRESVGIAAEAFVVGAVGRLVAGKSFDVLIKAVGRLNAGGLPTILMLIGEGDEKVNLQAVARQCGVFDKVLFLGLQKDVRAALSMIDVFALPSSAVETFSNAALEAMSMGRPVVLSRLGGAEEMAVDRSSGMLFDVGDTDELVRILATLHGSAELRERIGAAGRKRVLELFRSDDMVRSYQKLASL